MRSVLRGFAFGARLFSRNPVFAAIFVIALAAGIGSAVSVFTVIDALLLRPVAVSHPEQLVGLTAVYRGHSLTPMSYPMCAELERNQHAFSGLCAWTAGSDFNVEIDGSPSLVNVRSVTGSYFPVLGVHPALGRLIGPADAQGQRVAQVAVISYRLWKERFAGDPGVVGRTLKIDGKSFTIVGVTGQWFTGMTPGSSPEITVPAGAGQLYPLESRTLLWLFATGRLAPGSTFAQADAQLKAIWPRVLESTVAPESTGARRQAYLSMGLQVDPVANGSGFHGDLRSQLQRPLNLLLGIVALILLVICVNLASLTLARASARRREIGTRIALGASPWQAVRGFVAETLLLSCCGGVLALLLSSWGSRFLIALMTRNQNVPALLDVRPDWRVMLFAVSIALATGLLTGLIPAWQLSRRRAGLTMGTGARTLRSGTGRFNKALIISQVAISLILLQTAGLFLRTLESLKSFDPGFEKVGVTEFDLTPKLHGLDGVNLGSYRKQLADAVASLPSVRSAAFSNTPLLESNEGWKDAVVPMPGAGRETFAGSSIAVTPGFFKTLGMSLLAGRDFTWTDDAKHPHVVILDDRLAKELFPGERAIGKHVRFGVQPFFSDLEVVGITQTARLLDIRDGSTPYLYVAAPQYWDGKGDEVTLVVRAAANADVAGTVEREVESFGREYSARTGTLKERSEGALANERMTATLSAFFALIALLVAGFGLFGLLSYSVTMRTGEIGVRMALGSQRAGILKLVLREAAQVTLWGIAFGVPCAIAVSRLFAQMLFSLSFADPATLAMAGAALLLTGLTAGLLPAVRAMRLEPVEALRHE